MRCAAHNLATGPDGLCALCRSGSNRAGAGAEQSSALGAWVVVGLICAAALVILAVGGLRAALRKDRATAEPLSSAAIASAAFLVEQAGPAEDRERELGGEVAEPAPMEEPSPALAPVDEPSRGTALATSAPRSSAAPSVVKPKAFSEADIRAAMRQVPVTMYVTSWCKVCHRARAFFRVNGIPVVEKDVESSIGASREQRALNPSGSVPTIRIEERVFVGFSEQELTRMLVTSAVRRLQAR